jgi:hypothetical protein
MADPRRFPSTEERSTDRGFVRVARPVEGVVLTRVEGFASLELGATLIAWVDEAFGEGTPLTVFHDWELAEGYEPALRPRFTDWYLHVRSKTSGIHVLTRSKLVTMGVSLVSIATGNEIRAYRERKPFERALEAAVLEAKVSRRRPGS